MKLPVLPADMIGQAAALINQGQAKAAERLLKTVLRSDPGNPEALVMIGVLCGMQGQLNEAVKHLSHAARRRPSSDAAHYNLGQALIRLGRYEEAAQALERAAALADRAEIHEKLGDCLLRLDKIDESIRHFARAVELDPSNSLALSSLIEAKRRACDWPRLGEHEATLVALARQGHPVEPLLMFHVDDDPALHRSVCERYWKDLVGTEQAYRPAASRGSSRAKPGRIRIGYLSGDFRRHPMVSVIAEAMELHDRSRFEVHGFSYGQDDASPQRKRMAAAFEKFHDVRAAATTQIVKRIAQAGIDILIDLGGYTANARLDIVAARPAPVMCHYMGFPGTMGTAAIDYVIADRIVAPDGALEHFSEALVRLPECYWAIDRKRPVADDLPARATLGLPEDGIVFASFNGQQKLTPALFDVWARIMSAVPGSVLWFYCDHPPAVENIRREIASRGIDASRLVFADRVPQPEHLARMRIADLILDTLPYGGHTTTADALWMGVPIITIEGRSFASRVGVSLLKATGMDDLALPSLEAYEHEAIALASEPHQLAALRERMRSMRGACPLFDTARFTRHLEAAYVEIWRRAQDGVRPQTVDVPAIDG
ncbi:MAG: tetratricopeptide repeat protein [Hyphomicrobiaceae bacterium]